MLICGLVPAMAKIWDVELWTCPSNGIKFLGVRVYWGNSRLERKSALLAPTLYRPSVKAFKKRNAEMFEATSILSAMQVLMFSLCLPVIVCMCVYLTRFVYYYVCVSTWLCV